MGVYHELSKEVFSMTKKQFLLKMGIRLLSLPGKRRDEILNHYRSVIDQSMANGNTEESSVEALGDVNNLCRLVLKKEKKPTFVPIIFTVLDYLVGLVKILCVVVVLAVLAGIVGLAVTGGYSLLMTTMDHFIPSGVLLSSNIAGAMFKIGACIIMASMLLVLVVIIKSTITAIVKVIIHIANKVKDAVYGLQTTKLMKEAFKGESAD